MAFLSKRLRDADALPKHVAILDSPHRVIKKDLIGGRLVEFEQYYHQATATIWGGYDYWCRKYRIWQKKRKGPEGDDLPEWVGENAFYDKTDEYVFNVAGQYSSCAACNIAAHLIGWRGTVLVLGNLAKGRYCETVMKINKPSMTADNAKIMAADRRQWSYLYRGALKSGIEIVHLEPSPVDSLPVISEMQALEALSAHASAAS